MDIRKLFSNRSVPIIAVTALMACATTGTTSTTSGARRDPNLLTGDEIAASNQATAYDAIARLRPMFLKTRGRTTVVGQANDYAVVFVNGQRFGDLSSLRGISASTVAEARFVPGTDAVTRYGMEYGAGVIDIKTR